jgi:UDP-glucose 4-epimerase
MNLDGKTILITGGAGMIGSATVDLLLRDHRRTRIVILDDLSRGTTANIESALKHPRVRFVLGDISDAATVASACRNVDAVIHLAAQRITACAADPRRAMEVMCDGSFNVVEAAPVACKIAASLASIYGLADVSRPRDHHPYNNQTGTRQQDARAPALVHAMYACVCRVRHLMCRCYGHARQVRRCWCADRLHAQPAAADPATVSDDGLRPHRRCREGQRVGAASDCDDDVINVASGRETSLRELAAALLKVMGATHLVPEYGPERSVNPVLRRLASTRKAQSLLGFRAEVGLEEGLDRLVRWWQKNRTLEVTA